MFEVDERAPLTKYYFRGYSLDPGRRCLLHPRGNPARLSSRALDTLQLLVAHRGETLSKDFLVENVWPGVFVDENNLNQAITNIRKALGDSKTESPFIKTVPGRGYCFVAELDEPGLADSTVSLACPAGEQPPETCCESLPSDDTQARNASHAWRRSAVYGIAVLAFAAIIGATILSLSNLLSNRKVTPAVASAATTAGPSIPQSSPPQAKDNQKTIPNSIAVMPLKILNPSMGEDGKIFALGLHAELINQLSEISSLNLVSRRTVLSPGIQELSVPEIGGLLKVEAVITGTVLFFESEARINLQMLDPVTRMIKWTFVSDVDTQGFKDLLDVQTQIAAGVTEGLTNDLGLDALPVNPGAPTESFEAFRFNIAAQRAYDNRNFAKSLYLSKRALNADSEYLDALYNFSIANYHLSSHPLPGMTTSEHIRAGLDAAQRFIDLAPEKYQGYVLKAVALANEHRWEEAMAQVSQLEKMHAPLGAFHFLAPMLMSLGEHSRTIAILETHLKLDPINSYGRGYLMAAHEATGNIAQARLEFGTGEELTPDWWGDTVNIFLSLGRGEMVNLDGVRSSRLKNLLSLYNQGDDAALISSLNLALHEEYRTSAILVHYAALAAVLEQDEMAIQFMSRATDILPMYLHWAWLPVFRKTWRHPDFTQLLERVGVLAYWQKHGPPQMCQLPSMRVICSSEGLAFNP